MKRKYLKKINATYRFKLRVLTADEFKDLDEDGKHNLWRIYLNSLYKTNQISKHQSRTWTYPTEELK